jgi:hypothetical protein
MVTQMFFRIRESQWLEYRDGQLDAATWASYSEVFVRVVASNPGLLAKWRENTQLLDPGFVREIDPRLPSAPPQQAEKKESAQPAQ